MNGATLEIVDLAGGLKRITVDCLHGTTEGLANDIGGIGDAAIVASLLIKHFAEEGCECTQALRRQYPPSLLPGKTLRVML